VIYILMESKHKARLPSKASERVGERSCEKRVKSVSRVKKEPCVCKFL